MSDSENAIEAAPSSEESPAESAPGYVHDWALVQLVQFANLGFEQHVTLTVGGSQINGRLISGRRFFEHLVAAMENAAEGHDVDPESDFAAVLGIYRENRDGYPNLDDENAVVPPQPTYIHLEDARWHSTDGRVLPANGMIWRGKISAVDGFSIGQFQAEDS